MSGFDVVGLVAMTGLAVWLLARHRRAPAPTTDVPAVPQRLTLGRVVLITLVVMATVVLAPLVLLALVFGG